MCNKSKLAAPWVFSFLTHFNEYMSQQVAVCCYVCVCMDHILTHVSWSAFVHLSVRMTVCTLS